MGQREEIERLVGEAYADLRLQKWGEFERKVSELSLYPRSEVEFIIREKMGKVQPIRAMRLAHIRNAVSAFPLAHEQKEGTETPLVIMTKLAVVPPTLIEVPEVKYSLPKLAIETRATEQQRWVGALIDAEGSFSARRMRRDMITPKEYKYEYLVPVFQIEMFDEQPMSIFAELTKFTLHHYPPRYTIYEDYATAVAMAKWAIPYLVPSGHRFKQALRILRTFSEHPSIKVKS